MATGELPSMFLPLLAPRVTCRKWSCCVCRVILGLEAISRGIRKASSSALLQMDFEGVNLAHWINVFGLSNSKELWRKKNLVFFFFSFEQLSLQLSVHCMEASRFTQQEMDVGKGASLGVAQQERGVLPTQGTWSHQQSNPLGQNWAAHLHLRLFLVPACQ